MLLFADSKVIYIVNGAIAAELPSSFIEKHIENMRRLNEKDEWKRSGKGAVFMYGAMPLELNEENIITGINGIVRINDEEVLYSVTAGSTSGIFIKSLLDAKAAERHVIHSGQGGFGQIDFNAQKGLIATSRSQGVVSDVAVFSLEEQALKTITGGDSVDENPSFGALTPAIFFNSRGIGRNVREEVVDFSNSYICAVTADGATIKDVLEIPNYDLIKPREDSQGKLFFIKKPYKNKKGTQIKISDVLLAPFRIIKALFGWLNLKSMQYGGQALNTAGANPAKNKQKSKQEMIIDGNLIDASYEISQNQKKGEKFAGFAPRSWELSCYQNGETKLIRRGVLDYIIDQNGCIVFTNGRHIIRINENGSEDVLFSQDSILKIAQ